MFDNKGKNKKFKIAASILDCDFLHLADEIDKAVNLGVDMLHIDVMDGLFVPNITIGQQFIKKIRDYTNIFLDVHLMIKNPSRCLESFIECKPDLLTVHVEECTHLSYDLYKIKQSNIKACVALNPSTPIYSIENVLSYLDMVLIMTVNPGYGGQKLLPECLAKIENLNKILREQGYKNGYKNNTIDIQVDGGINENTAKLVIDAGANVLVLGSAIYKASNPSDVIDKIKMYFY